MFKIFVLQQCHGLSDFELEKHCIDRISFRKFLGFSDRILDKTTVWSSRRITIGDCKEEEIWTQLQSQLNCLGLKMKPERFRILLLSIQILDIQKRINLDIQKRINIEKIKQKKEK